MAYDPAREERKAQAVALVKQGYSFQAAEDATGVPLSTTHRALKALEAGTATAADLFAADQQLMAKTYALASAAQTEQLERLRAGAETRDVNVMAGISMRAISNFRRWNAPQADHGEPGAASKLLDRLELALTQGATLSLTVSPRPPDADAIDVEAIPDE